MISNEELIMVATTEQGRRESNEDRVDFYKFPDLENHYMFAVYDGHGGSIVSQIISLRLRDIIIVNLSTYKRTKDINDIVECLYASFAEMDKELTKFINVGSTACVCIVTETKIICANVGDCRAMAFDSENFNILNTDHRTCNKEEKNRIYAAGGFVRHGYVNERLAVTRAFGDFSLKYGNIPIEHEYILISKPEITVSNKLEHLFICCDGITDILDDQGIKNYVYLTLNNSYDPNLTQEEKDDGRVHDLQILDTDCHSMVKVERIVDTLFYKHLSSNINRCAIKKGSADNCTNILVKFKNVQKD